MWNVPEELGHTAIKWLNYVVVNTNYRHPMKACNKKNLKFWADVADKICFGHTLKLGIGIWFSAMQSRRFPHRASVVRHCKKYYEYCNLSGWKQIWTMKSFDWKRTGMKEEKKRKKKLTMCIWKWSILEFVC